MRCASAALCLLLTAAASGCAGLGAALGRAPVPMQLRGEQIIVALPLVAPTLLRDEALHLARQYDLVPMMRGFALPSIGVHCMVFEVPFGTDAEAVLRELERHPGVRLAQRNQHFETNGAQHSDPYADLQHAPATMRVDRAHEVSLGRGVQIVVVDTGIDRNHRDLRGRVVASQNFVQGGEATFEDDAHGTAVAGVIAARADDGIGIYGVAPEAELMAAKACWHSEAGPGRALCSSWTLARAIDYAIESGARVLNVSLGGPYDPLLARLLDRARERGIVSVAAAGPQAEAPRFPASLASVIAVVANDEAPGPTSGAPKAKPDGALVAAPGAEIITTAPGDAYHFQSGSSLSAAHVSGLVALLLERDPSLSPERVQSILAGSARREASNPGAVGVADACAALARVGAAACRDS